MPKIFSLADGLSWQGEYGSASVHKQQAMLEELGANYGPLAGAALTELKASQGARLAYRAFAKPGKPAGRPGLAGV